jgi:hypothetical protein
MNFSNLTSCIVFWTYHAFQHSPLMIFFSRPVFAFTSTLSDVFRADRKISRNAPKHPDAEAYAYKEQQCNSQGGPRQAGLPWSVQAASANNEQHKRPDYHPNKHNEKFKAVEPVAGSRFEALQVVLTKH